eukprot:4159615-Pyramimonas_sp.AAC.1
MRKSDALRVEGAWRLRVSKGCARPKGCFVHDSSSSSLPYVPPTGVRKRASFLIQTWVQDYAAKSLSMGRRRGKGCLPFGDVAPARADGSRRRFFITYAILRIHFAFLTYNHPGLRTLAPVIPKTAATLLTNGFTNSLRYCTEDYFIRRDPPIISL